MMVLFKLDEIGRTVKEIVKTSPSKTVCFYGQMGSGKTTLIKALVHELGGEDNATSPTFGIVNEYHKRDGSLLGYHFDFYRLEDETEALDLGLEDYLNQNVWVFIEWPEKIKSFLPLKTTDVHIKIIDSKTRKLDIR